MNRNDPTGHPHGSAGDDDWIDILLGKVVLVQIDDEELTLVLTYSDGRRIIISGGHDLAISEEDVPQC